MIQNELLSKIKNGGQAELGLIYEEYRLEFIQWIMKEYHCSIDDSKDIYQVTILIFYDNVRQGKLERLVSSVKTYLYGIGKNIALETIRKQNKNTPIDQEKWFKEFLIDETEITLEEDKAQAVKNALLKLGEPCRQLIELFYYERKTMEDIATQLDYKNAETAKNQKCKCMARLRKIVEREFTKLTTAISHEQQ
ncbi:MAG: sigma-70 family RNA polymerase sigma factor [Cyclobacteriaceae bacterium]|nr:sigma-70 family RNA polymerase sigma factor [Cyclobacteriaceae bacterium]